MPRGYRRAGVRRGRPRARSRRRRGPRRGSVPRWPSRRNVLLITVDQWRGDCLGAVGHPGRADAEPRPARRRGRAVPPPLRAGGAVRPDPRVAAHRAVPDEPPLGAQRHAARRAVHEPRARGARRRLRPGAVRLHRRVARPAHARARRPAPAAPTRACCPGYRAVRRPARAPRARGARGCATQGYDVPDDVRAMYEPVSDAPGAPVAYAAEHTEAAFLTGAVLDHVDEHATEPWFVHAAYIRPAPAVRRARSRTTSMYDPATVPDPVRARRRSRPRARSHPVLAGAVAIPGVRGSATTSTSSARRAPTYYGMMTEVDAQLGRLFDGLRERGAWDDTLVVLTSDHGEQLGDHWLTEKLGWFEQSYHIPCIVRDPDARRRDAWRVVDGPLHRERRRDADGPRVARPPGADAVRRSVAARRSCAATRPCRGATPRSGSGSSAIRSVGWAEKILGITHGPVRDLGAARRARQVRALRRARRRSSTTSTRDPARARRTGPATRRTRPRCSGTRSACCRTAWSTWTRPSPASW